MVVMSWLRHSAFDAGHGDALDEEGLRHEEHQNHREDQECGTRHDQVPAGTPDESLLEQGQAQGHRVLGRIPRQVQ